MEVDWSKLWEHKEATYRNVAKKLLEEEEKGLREVLAISRRDEIGDIREAADIFNMSQAI